MKAAGIFSSGSDYLPGLKIVLFIYVFQSIFFITNAVCHSETRGNKKILPINVGGAEVEVELAITPEEHMVGLMYRDRLEDNKGMLFVFPKEEILSFWMKNTGIPLSIAFIKADGRIVQIESMEPYSLDTHVSKEKVKYALEMKEGWFRVHKVKEGDRVRIPLAVDEKIKSKN